MCVIYKQRLISGILYFIIYYIGYILGHRSRMGCMENAYGHIYRDVALRLVTRQANMDTKGYYPAQYDS